jgi:hypothetical protein
MNHIDLQIKNESQKGFMFVVIFELLDNNRCLLFPNRKYENHNIFVDEFVVAYYHITPAIICYISTSAGRF